MEQIGQSATGRQTRTCFPTLFPTNSKMEFAIKMGNIDALIKEAEDTIAFGDFNNGIKAAMKASTALSALNDSEYDEKHKKEVTTRLEKCSATVLKGTESIRLDGPKASQTQRNRKYGKIEDILVPADGNIFLQDFIGMQQAKLTLIQAILLPVGVLDLVDAQQRWKGILLFGGSGVGKSRLLKAFNNSIKMTTTLQISFIALTLDKINGAFHGDTEKNLSEFFKDASLKKPAVICIDEVDSLCMSRSKDGKNESEIKIVNHFLTLLDKYSLDHEVVVVGTTNKVHCMDFAFFRRFQKMLYVELPDLNEREQLLRSLVSKVQTTDFMNFKLIAAQTERFSSADLMLLVANAVNAVRTQTLAKKVLVQMEKLEKVEFEKLLCLDDFRPINEEDLKKALRTTFPTNTEEDIRKLDEFADKFCGRKERYSNATQDMMLPSARMLLDRPVHSILMMMSCFKDFWCEGC